MQFNPLFGNLFFSTAFWENTPMLVDTTDGEYYYNCHIINTFLTVIQPLAINDIDNCS